METTNKEITSVNGAANHPPESDQQATRRIAEMVKPAVSRVVSGIAQGTSAVKSGVEKASDKLADGHERLLQEGRTLVCQRPYTALGLAALTGLAVSLLVSRR